VTTLRYTPDKPYKLQIYAVNSEVEIFGMTDDLYYIRHGKNYGFLPKNHLREKARGNYPFQVEIDLSTRRIDQQVREQNFLFEFLKSSQPQVEDMNMNETIAAPALNETEPSQDNVVSANDKPQEVPLDAPADVKTDVNSEQQPQAALESDENDNDSGIDEDDEDEDDNEEDSEEVIENSPPASNPKVEENQQPELIAIPPGKDTDTHDSSNEVLNEEEKQPLALAIPASATEEIKPQFNTAENSTVENPQKPVENIPEFVPIKNDAIEQAGNILQVQNETEKAVPEAVVAQKVPEEKIVAAPQVVETPKVEEVKADSQQPPPVTEVPVVEKIPEPIVEKIPEPVVEKIPEPIVEKISEPVVEKTPEPIVEKIPDRVIETTPTPIVEKVPEVITEKTPEPVVEKKPEAIIETIPAPVIEKRPEPAPVTEENSELPLNNIQRQEKVLVPEVHVEAEIIAPPTVKEPEVQTFEQTTPQPPQIPIAPEVPAIVEKPQQKVVAPQPTPIPVIKKPAEPDALLKRFNEKLGHRIVEGTGKGSVESLHKPEDHSHHGHDHSHHGHDHSHHGHDHHDHEKKAPSTDNVEKLPEEPQAQKEEEKPGFFAGLFSSFFSDKDDSEQHFHETETAEKVENVFTTTTEKSGEFYLNFTFLI
jgi:Cornifin (SPRR) family